MQIIYRSDCTNGMSMTRKVVCRFSQTVYDIIGLRLWAADNRKLCYITSLYWIWGFPSDLYSICMHTCNRKPAEQIKRHVKVVDCLLWNNILAVLWLKDTITKLIGNTGLSSRIGFVGEQFLYKIMLKLQELDPKLLSP